MAADDIFFLTLPEVHDALDGMDFRVTVQERRALFAQESLRRTIPLVLLSDGTTPVTEPDALASAGAMLRGLPPAPGRTTGLARVVYDPHDSTLMPGRSWWHPPLIPAGHRCS